METDGETDSNTETETDTDTGTVTDTDRDREIDEREDVKEADAGQLLWVRGLWVDGEPERRHTDILYPKIVVSDISVLDDGSFIVVGDFTGSATFGRGEANETILATDSTQYFNSFVAKYTAFGKLLWVRRSEGGGQIKTTGVAVFGDGSIVVTGDYLGLQIFGAGEPAATTLISAGPRSMFVAWFAPDGSLIFVEDISGQSSNAHLTSGGVAPQQDGSVIISGSSTNSCVFNKNKTSEFVLESGHVTECLQFLTRYLPDGEAVVTSINDGVVEPWAIETLPGGGVFQVGWFLNNGVFGAGQENETVLETYDTNRFLFLAHHDAGEALQWVVTPGTDGPEVPYVGQLESSGVSAWIDGSSIVTGRFKGDAIFGSGEPNETVLEAGVSAGIFVVKYNQDSTLAWARQTSKVPDIDVWDHAGRDVVALPDGSLLVTGRFEETCTFGEGEPNETTVTSIPGDYRGTTDVFLSKYSAQGAVEWVSTAGGPHSDSGEKLAATTDSAVLLIGTWADTAEFGAGEPNQTVLGPDSESFQSSFIAKYQL